MGAPGLGPCTVRMWWLRFLDTKNPVAKLGDPGLKAWGLGTTSGVGDLGSSVV